MKKLLFALLFVWSSAFAINEELCKSLIDAEDYSRAIQVGQELIRRNPNSYWARWCLSKAYHETGDFQKSLEHAKALERLARNDRELLLAYNRLGLVCSELGDLDSALNYYMKVLSLSRKVRDGRGEIMALNNIAGIYEKKGEYQKALEYYMKSLELQDDPKEKATTLNNIGNVYYRLGDYKTAERYYKQSKELSENSENFYGVGILVPYPRRAYKTNRNFSTLQRRRSSTFQRRYPLGAWRGLRR